MLRSLSVFPLALALATALAADGSAQVKVQTESIKPSQPPAAAPPEVSQAPGATGTVPAKKPTDTARSAPRDSAPPPEVIFDVSRLPEPVKRTREKLLAAARSGDLNQVAAVMRSMSALPIFSLNDDKDPIPFWKANYPDSDGVEVLSILIGILESGFVHVDKDTPQDMYVWPYFARMQIKNLSSTQKVELFRFVTGADFKDMLDFGAYNFYRLGISPDGTWQYFVAGD
jgi:hypothetical protein